MYSFGPLLMIMIMISAALISYLFFQGDFGTAVQELWMKTSLSVNSRTFTVMFLECASLCNV